MKPWLTVVSSLSVGIPISDMPTNEVCAKVSAFVRNNQEVVNAPDGTGKKGAVPSTEIPGKTGTAQFWRNVEEVVVPDLRIGTRLRRDDVGSSSPP